MQRRWQPPCLDDSTKLGKSTDSVNSANLNQLPAELRSTPVIALLPPSLIVPGIYVGSMADGADVLWKGNSLGVGAVVNCAQEEWLHQVRKGRCGQEACMWTSELRESFDALSDAPEGHAKRGQVMGVHYLGFSAKDIHSFESPQKGTGMSDETPEAMETVSKYPVSSHFAASLAFIREHLEKGETVLVHCLRGENRSAAVCAAFLIRERGMSAAEAIELLRQKRGEGALSNQGFVDEINIFFHKLQRERKASPTSENSDKAALAAENADIVSVEEVIDVTPTPVATAPAPVAPTTPKGSDAKLNHELTEGFEPETQEAEASSSRACQVL
mmetsp:Transcript_119698/g.211584  ORF Transcript_119698/g.211584 Transcript_119698/m.211584 type:complete len:330 (-) Transcript_119698:130-1119(-)